MITRRPWRILAATAALMLAVAACSNGGSDTPTPSAPPSSSASASDSPTSASPTSTASTSPTKTASIGPTSRSPKPVVKPVFTKEQDGITYTLMQAGRCTTSDGVFTIVTKDFTPGGQRWTLATKPNGEIYTLDEVGNPGVVAKDGSIPGWQWTCMDSLDGDHEVSVVDLGSIPHRKISFTITVHSS